MMGIKKFPKTRMFTIQLSKPYVHILRNIIKSLCHLIVHMNQGLDFIRSWAELPINTVRKSFVDFIALIFYIIPFFRALFDGSFFALVNEIFGNRSMILHKIILKPYRTLSIILYLPSSFFLSNVRLSYQSYGLMCAYD